MNLRVPFHTDASIEGEANALLQSYGLSHSPVIEPPVPVEEILESFLHLTFELRDLRTAFGKPDILGVLYVGDRRVAIDSQLDPTIHPEVLGRYRFTVGHEIGHWQLHREYFRDAAREMSLFVEDDTTPSVICRDSQRREPAEWQADRLSAALLMPRALVAGAWGVLRGNSEPVVSEREFETTRGGRRRLLSRAGETDPFVEFEMQLFNRAARSLAPAFEVSVEAMRIRLETLRFLVRTSVPELPLVGVSK